MNAQTRSSGSSQRNAAGCTPPNCAGQRRIMACRVTAYPAAVSRLPTNRRPGNAANSAARNRCAGASAAPGPSERPIWAVRVSMSAQEAVQMLFDGANRFVPPARWPATAPPRPPPARTTATPTTNTSDRAPRRSPSYRTSAGAPNSSRKIIPCWSESGTIRISVARAKASSQHRPAMTQPNRHEGERAEQAQHDPQERKETARGEQADRQNTGQHGFRRGGQEPPAPHPQPPRRPILPR